VTAASLAGSPRDKFPASQLVELMWPVKPVVAFPADRPVEAGPENLRLALIDLVAAAVPDMKAHLQGRGLREVGYPTWFITTGRAAGLKESLDEVLVCRVEAAPLSTTLLRESVTP
jgi:hypothetical protein